MPADRILVPHDDGRWYEATLLGQHRSSVDGSWRVGVRYYTAPGFQYQRVLPATDCRPMPDQGDYGDLPRDGGPPR